MFFPFGGFIKPSGITNTRLYAVRAETKTTTLGAWAHDSLEIGMKVKFFTHLTYLRISGSLAHGIQVMDGLFVTNDKQYISTIVTEQYRPQIGSLEYNFLLDGVLAYSTMDGVDESDFEAKAIAMLEKLNHFEHAFWMIQDCCMGHEVGFICNHRRITSVRHGGHYTLASGHTETLECSAEGFRSAVRAIRPKTQSMDFSKRLKTHNAKKVEPITLALHLIGFAQLTGFIPTKISFYCSALEALLSTSQAELSHQIAERVAVVAKLEEPRLETYKFMKKCYSLRSKYVHGDTVSQPEEEIINLSVKLDAVVRATFHALLENDDLRQAMDNKNALDEILLQRILEGRLSD
jgi:hypothetical protein